MRTLIKQLASTVGAAFAAACCLGVTAIVSGVTAIGAGFLIKDVGAVVALVGLWISPFLIYAGLIVLVAASFGDFMRARRHGAA